MTTRGIAAVLALVAVALGSWLILDGDRPDATPAETGNAAAESKVDYFMAEAKLTRYDETGHIHYELETDRAEHYRDAEETRAETVSLVYYDTDRPPWTVEADRSVVPDHGEQVHLQGNVRGDYRTAQEEAPLVLLTPAATVLPEADLMTSDAGVRIIQRQDQVTAERMEANLATGVVHLRGNVHGVLRSRYVR